MNKLYKYKYIYDLNLNDYFNIQRYKTQIY